MVKNCPIAVYQMGKVGSETILYSLQQLDLRNPIYHIHILSPRNLEISIKYLTSNNFPLTMQLEHSKILRNYLDRYENPELQVITAVREPISQLISAIFQNIKNKFPHFIEADGNWKYPEIYAYLENLILNYNIQAPGQNCNWFDNDFKNALGIDVYNYDFDRENGYAVIEEKNIDVLILRLETSEIWSKPITDFLKLPNELQLIKRNTASIKDYKDTYEKILSNLKFPVSVLERIYSSKYCQHFYSRQMIEEFIKRWN